MKIYAYVLEDKKTLCAARFLENVPTETNYTILEVDKWPQELKFDENKNIIIDDSKELEKLKSKQIIKINQECSKSITEGFTSSALGNVYSYPSSTTDQLNINSVAMSGEGFLWCLDNLGNWNFIKHTKKQSSQVQKDMLVFIQSQQNKYANLIAQINQANTNNDIFTINW
jgi:hypothetical protein